MNKHFDLSGRVAVITGGARGIGLMIAAGYALNGARVAISSRDGAAGERAVVRLNEIGVGGCFSVPGDLSKREEIDRVLAVVEEEFGGELHVLVNNSGAAGGSRIDNYDMDEWDSTLNLNVTVPMYMTRQCVGMLEAAGTHEDPASVIMVGSTDALKAPGGSSTNYAYSTSKAGLHWLTTHLCLELGPRNITCNCIAPGPVATKINARILDPKVAEGTARAVPTKRMGDTQDMAGPCLFLSSRAGSWITGVTIAVGGGIAFGVANM